MSLYIFLFVCFLWVSGSFSLLWLETSWDFEFENNLEGWNSATAEEQHMELNVKNGELSGSIQGSQVSIAHSAPYLISPSMFLNITRRHFVVMRMKYFGDATTGVLLLKTSSSFPTKFEKSPGQNYWTNSLSLSAISSSLHQPSQSHAFAVDGDKYTYFESISPTGVYLILDLGETRTVGSFSVLPLEGSRSPRRCLLQKSTTISGAGPFVTVQSFTIPPSDPHLSSGASSSSPYQFAQPVNGSWDQEARQEEGETAGTGTGFKSSNGFEVSGFLESSRFWRLLVLDNYGGPSIGIRELALRVLSPHNIAPLSFPLDNSGQYRTYYLPLYPTMLGFLTEMRLEFPPQMRTKDSRDPSPDPLPPSFFSQSATNPSSPLTPQGGKLYRSQVSFDFIRVVRAPDILRVRGCRDRYYQSQNLLLPQYQVQPLTQLVNDHLPLRSFKKGFLSLPYSSTYDCPLRGGINLTIEGMNFGPQPRVFVSGTPCPLLSYEDSLQVHSLSSSNPPDPTSPREERIVCLLPPSLRPGGPQNVRVENGLHPGLFQEAPLLSYRSAPPVPLPPIPTNIGSRRIDLVWTPPGDEFQNMAVTGYKILWFQPQFRSRVSNLTLGNVTTTSIRGLTPNTQYVFTIAAISEGALEGRAALPTDLYGRREHLSEPDGFLGEFSVVTNITATLNHDFDFDLFNSNKTLNISSRQDFRNSPGPTGQFGSEGHFGLVMVGDANIQNCNVSSTCCDGFNASLGLSSCGSYASVCAVLPERALSSSFVLGGVTRREVSSNLPHSNGLPPDINILTLQDLVANKGADLPSIACGPALRLTPSQSRSSGSAWYPRKMNVLEGFDTTFEVEISNPSQRCDRLDDVNTYCRSRGADGLAFVLQDAAPDALGEAGSGLGYAGIPNSLAVELDTYSNFELLDLYENHISVNTRGWRHNISANHSFSLASSSQIPDLTDGRHRIRIQSVILPQCTGILSLHNPFRYVPYFDLEASLHPSFRTTGMTTYFIENADFVNGGQGDWTGGGLGLLSVYVDDLSAPALSTPLDLASTLDLADGRCYVGLTAATGHNHWQTHDILSWQFDSLYSDIAYSPPLIVNGEGAHRCVGPSRNRSQESLTQASGEWRQDMGAGMGIGLAPDDGQCVHSEDYLHYMRPQNLWGRGFDNEQGWQEGKEGYCSNC